MPSYKRRWLTESKVPIETLAKKLIATPSKEFCWIEMTFQQLDPDLAIDVVTIINVVIINLTKEIRMQKIVTFLWFNDQAKDPAKADRVSAAMLSMEGKLNINKLEKAYRGE